MLFAKRVFLVAGCYGLVATLPLYFLEGYVGEKTPPAITHPEYYYGFIGVVVAFQILFLVLARDPRRYRPMMIPSVIEKLTFGVAVPILVMHDRTAALMLGAAIIDLVWAGLFVAAYMKTAES